MKQKTKISGQESWIEFLQPFFAGTTIPHARGIAQLIGRCVKVNPKNDDLVTAISTAFMFTSLRANCDANRSIAEETERSYKTNKFLTIWNEENEKKGR